jgi:transposase
LVCRGWGVAIDVAKYRNEVLIEAVRGGRRRRMTILNTRGDHDKLVTALQAIQQPVVVGLEPTGNYRRVLAHRLIDAGFAVRLISSMALARTREAFAQRSQPVGRREVLHLMRNLALPGRHITDCQTRLLMSFRQTDTPVIAAAKAGFNS